MTDSGPFKGFPGGSEVKASTSNVGDPGSIPGSGTSPGEGNGNPLQYPCLKDSMDRGLAGYSPSRGEIYQASFQGIELND